MATLINAANLISNIQADTGLRSKLAGILRGRKNPRIDAPLATTICQRLNLHEEIKRAPPNWFAMANFFASMREDLLEGSPY